MAFSLVLHGHVPKDEICGVIVGHGTFRVTSLPLGYLKRTSKLTWAACIVWYFFNDVYPSLHDDHRPFDPPMWWRRIFEGRPAENTDASPINNEIAAAAAPDVR